MLFVAHMLSYKRQYGMTDLVTADQNKPQQDEIAAPLPEWPVLAQNVGEWEQEAVFGTVSCLRHEPCGGGGDQWRNETYRMGEVLHTGHEELKDGGRDRGNNTHLENKNIARTVLWHFSKCSLCKYCRQLFPSVNRSDWIFQAHPYYKLY